MPITQAVPGTGKLVNLHTAGAATANGLILAIPPGMTKHTIYIIGSAGIASGAVQPESASDPDYAGTWAQLGGGPITVVASTELVYSFEGSINALRVRISTIVVGGTVTVVYRGSK